MPSPDSHITRRRASSVTRDNEFQLAAWPVATASLLQDFERLESNHAPDQINQPLFALIRARKALGDARLAIHAARSKNVGNAAVFYRLNDLSHAIRQLQADFPLSVIGQPLAR